MGSKGGGGGGPTESTVTQTNLPEYAEPYYRDLLARTGYESAVPYQTFGGPRLEYFQPAEQTAMKRMTDLGMSGTPVELEMAGQIAAQTGLGNPYAGTMLEVTRRAQEMPGYASGLRQGNVYSGYSPQFMTDESVMRSYMNPYTKLVTDPQVREARRQSEIAGQQLGLQAAGIGSLGGYREAVMQAERERNLQQQIGDIYGTGLQQAYDRAAGAFQFGEQARQQAAAMGMDAARIEQAGRIAEEQARARAVEMNFAQAQRAAQLGQSAYSQLLGGEQQRLASAGMLGDFVGQRQQMELERLRAMQTAGQIERELRQRGLDIGYSDFLRQQAYPRENLAFYSSMLQGIPIAPGQISQSYGITPSMTQQLLGAGIAGVGLYNAFR
tara:strand:+ start:463 stop:1611 length:1149 start_codon:yes stop_codon:yes gene_type:complete